MLCVVLQLQSVFVAPLLLTHLQLSVWVQISISKRQQRLQYHLLGEGTVRISRAWRTVEGEQEAASDHQPLWEDLGGLVERFGDAADVIVQQSAVELRERKGGVKRERLCMCV